jgi:hypothetical protein
LIPPNLWFILGLQHTQATLTKVFDLLQHDAIVKSIAYTILDEALVVLFPDAQNDLREITNQFLDELQKIRDMPDD